MKCDVCGRDLNDLGQDNMSYKSGYILCEDCNNNDTDETIYYEGW